MVRPDEWHDTWVADTVDWCLNEALGRFHAAGARLGFTDAQVRVKIATAPGLDQYVQTMLAAKYSETYETEAVARLRAVTEDAEREQVKSIILPK
jgi:hypothetical protein